VVRAASPAVGRTRAVEILRGGRSQVVLKHGYDELPGYGTLASWRAEELLGEVDELLEVGVLGSTGGRFPKLALDPAGANGAERAAPVDPGAPAEASADAPAEVPTGAPAEASADAPAEVPTVAPAGGQERPAGLRLAVLASGTGTNLQAILDRVHGR